jgi:Xaa-Pro dipeptidase
MHVSTTSVLPFTREEYAGRLERFRRGLHERGLGTALVTSPSNICYLVGFGHKGSGVRALVVQDGQDPTLVISSIEVGNAEALLGASPVTSYRTYKSYGVGSPARTIAEVLNENSREVREVGVEPQWWPASDFDELRAVVTDVKLTPITGLVNRQRLVKSGAELDCMRRAAMVSDKAAAAALAALLPGVTEGELAAIAMSTMIEHGGEYQSVWPNVKAGPTSGLVHTGWTERRVGPNDHVYIELSGSVSRYHAPLWRTAFVGTPDDERQRCATAIQQASDAVLDALRPGVTVDDIYRAQKAIVDEAGFGEHMLPLSGYSVGLGLPPSWMEGTSLLPGSDLVMEPGMAFHIGAYVLIPGRWAIAASQTAAVTADGHELLTRTDKGPLFL